MAPGTYSLRRLKCLLQTAKFGQIALKCSANIFMNVENEFTLAAAVLPLCMHVHLFLFFFFSPLRPL